jgi:hypothetical protein
MGTLTLMALVLAGAGCQAEPAKWSELGESSQEEAADTGRPVDVRGLHVVPLPGKYVTQLRAADVVRILKNVGCSNEQVVDIGTDLRDALAKRGAAQIMIGKKAEALIQVNNNKVLISSVTRGMFEYNLRTGQIGLPNVRPGQSLQNTVGKQ